MAQFSALQSRVQTEIIDASTAVTSLIPTWINAAIFWLQAKHNFQVQQAEAPFVTSSTPALGNSQTHIIGQIPADWKCKRGLPYYQLFIGEAVQMDWLVEREYVYRKWARADYNQVGPPSDLFIGEAENAAFPPTGGSPSNNMTGLNIETYPFPDGSSDWSDGNYRIFVPYYRYLPALVNSTDTSWFTLDGNQAEFVVRFSVYRGFLANEDEQRAMVHFKEAFGNWDGSRDVTLGGLARQVMDMDKGIVAQPARHLAMRRDVYAQRDQRRQ